MLLPCFIGVPTGRYIYANPNPDGANVVYTLQTIDPKTEKKYSHLWIVPTQGGEPRQFTFGKHGDYGPKWSPSGDRIAFLSNRADPEKGQTQLYIIPMYGGEARPVTNLKGSIQSFAWSPGGERIALAFKPKSEEALAREEDPQKKKLGVVSHHFDRSAIRFEGMGFFDSSAVLHIHVLDLATEEMTQITDGEYGVYAPVWSPNGEEILCLSNQNEDWDMNQDGMEFYLVPAGGGEMREVSSHRGMKHSASFSPDGNHIVYAGLRLSPGQWWQNTTIFIVSAEDLDEAAQDISSQTDIDFGSSTLGDHGSPPPPMPPTWSYDGRYIYCTATRHGGNPLCRFNGESGELEKLIDDGSVIGMVTLDEANSYAVYFRGTFTDPCQLWLLDLHTLEERQLTHHNRTLLEEAQMGTIEEHWIKGKDGNDIHGWILFPPDFDPSKTYPSILEIHGGPQTQYGRTFMHEFYHFAAQGYIVHFSNPRGGQGYGEEHASSISGIWGTIDYSDIMSWTDFVAEKSYIDTERMGITGGSYGGYLTAMTIGQTERFKASVIQRMVSNWLSFYGTSDMNWRAQYLAGFNGDPWDHLEHYWRMSPTSLVGNVTTPTLVVHSLGDLRTPAEQGEQYYVMLKKKGVEAEMLLLPQENHGLSRAGRTDRRIARLSHMVRWFDNYLKG
ncbi:MAG: S9 family peptidase [Chloroflexota bacterium]